MLPRRSRSFKHFLHMFFARLPKQKSSVWMRAEKVLIIFTSHSVPNQYQSPIKPHKRFKQTQHTKLFSKSIDGGMYDLVFIFYQSKMCGWLNATRATCKSAIEHPNPSLNSSREWFEFWVSHFTYGTYSCVLRFVQVLFCLFYWKLKMFRFRPTLPPFTRSERV